MRPVLLALAVFFVDGSIALCRINSCNSRLLCNSVIVTLSEVNQWRTSVTLDIHHVPLSHFAEALTMGLSKVIAAGVERGRLSTPANMWLQECLLPCHLGAL